MRRPNILWIQTDEQRPDSLGCYGSEWAKTPNIDALAARGVVFRNCVCNSPVCVPSRCSQLTGRYPQEVNAVHNQVAADRALQTNVPVNRVFPEGTITFPEIFAGAGYATASFGKWHTPNHPTWQVNQALTNLDAYSGYYDLNTTYKEDAYHVVKRPGGTSIILAGTYPTSEGHPSQVITDWAIEWLRSLQPEQPFLLRVSHNWPHTPVLAPPPFDALYAPDEIPIRFYDEAVYATRSARDRRIADRHRMRELTRDQIRQMWKDYMGLVSCVDHEAGRLMAALKALGLEGETVVLVSADHGKALGEWGATEKGFYDNEVWRVPFVMAGPGIEARGTVRDDICALIDTGRTLLGLAGLEAPEVFRGRNLLLEPAPDAVFGQIGWPDDQAPLFRQVVRRLGPTSASMRVAVRTNRHRMDVTWMANGQRVAMADADGNLFDLVDDPYETRNLWAEPGQQDVVAELWERIGNWFDGLDRTDALFSRT